jgi:hypothetical protein
VWLRGGFVVEGPCLLGAVVAKEFRATALKPLPAVLCLAPKCVGWRICLYRLGHSLRSGEDKIAKDWEACKQAVSTGTTEVTANEECSTTSFMPLEVANSFLDLFSIRADGYGPPIAKTFLP